MTALRFLYFVVYSRSRSRDGVDLRFNPSAFLVLLLQPVVNSLLGILLGLPNKRAPLVAHSDVLYAKYDTWTYLSMILTAVMVWRYFDRQRANILDEYANVALSPSAAWCVLGASVFYVFINFFIYAYSYSLNLILFGAILVLGQLAINRFITRLPPHKE